MPKSVMSRAVNKTETNSDKINQSGSPSSKSKQIVKSATTKNQNKCAHSSQKKNLLILTEKTVED